MAVSIPGSESASPTPPTAARNWADGVRGSEGIDCRNTRQQFFHSWDLYGFTIVPGDRIEHWFEVWDNDGVNGSKSARSTPQVFAAPTVRCIQGS